MYRPWETRTALDAVGPQEWTVRPTPAGGGRPAHVTVRVGPLAVYCLDPESVTETTTAWATAFARFAPLLPATERPEARVGAGFAVPLTEVVIEGRQWWQVVAPRPGQPYGVVSCSWLTVRVADREALAATVTAWAQAVDVAQRLWSPPPPAFSRLMQRVRMHEATLAASVTPTRQQGRER